MARRRRDDVGSSPSTAVPDHPSLARLEHNQIDDPYAILEIPQDADDATIKKAYRRLAKRHHPDLNPGNDDAAAQFKRVAAAFETLSDPARRQAHARSRRPVQGGLPQAFVDAVNDALDRAQAYVERMVLPHYASMWRGQGAVAVAVLWQDLDALRDTTFLADSEPSWVDRRRAQHLARDIVLDIDWAPAGDLSLRHRTIAGTWRVVLTPWVLHRMGIGPSAELDDAILRVVLQQYASVLASGRFRPPIGRRTWLEAMNDAETADRQEIAQRTARWAGTSLLVGVVLLLVYSGYASW